MKSFLVICSIICFALAFITTSPEAGASPKDGNPGGGPIAYKCCIDPIPFAPTPAGCDGTCNCFILSCPSLLGEPDFEFGNCHTCTASDHQSNPAACDTCTPIGSPLMTVTVYECTGTACTVCGVNGIRCTMTDSGQTTQAKVKQCTGADCEA